MNKKLEAIANEMLTEGEKKTAGGNPDEGAAKAEKENKFTKDAENNPREGAGGSSAEDKSDYSNKPATATADNGDNPAEGADKAEHKSDYSEDGGLEAFKKSLRTKLGLTNTK